MTNAYWGALIAGILLIIYGLIKIIIGEDSSHMRIIPGDWGPLCMPRLDGYSFPSAPSSLLCPFALCGAVKGSPSQNNTLMKMWREPKRHWTACI